jgi:hypothetical protein
VAAESATVDGTPVANGQVLPLLTGPHTLTVTTTFGDGSSQSPQVTFDAP